MKKVNLVIFVFLMSFLAQKAYSQSASSDLKIQMILTKQYFASFDLAKPNAIDEIKDGDPLWLYIKSNKPFKDIVKTSRITQSDGSVLKYYTLLLKLGPNNDMAPYNDNCELCFGEGKECANSDRVPREMLEKNELILNLTTYDSKGSSRVMLSTVGNGSPGNWDNQVRLYVNDDKVASARLHCKVEDGIAQYRKMWLTYKDVMAKGDENSNELPEPTTYENAALKKQIIQQVKQRGITPAKVYFMMNGWKEIDYSAIEKYRYITAAFTYQKKGKCFYGVARVKQDYSFSLVKYGDSMITLEDMDTPVKCK